MKHSSKLTLLFLLLQIALLSLPANAAHVRSDCIVTLCIQPLQESDYPIVKDKGHRSQSQHFTMLISEGTGVNIANFDKTRILTYEVYDASEECIDKFCDEYEFTDFILSQTEPVLIMIFFDDFILYGWTN